ncbi:sensor histidine kinase [Oceanomicrobium pacificus]|uniref:histidine kinase n=1 Tax=Oceanomicrobium pacificus TaxID=2692916 RepID=A0A6B0TQD5_9RHOB|nr:sensor histidine kinase [Oceanomicrobium pacificus]MXU64899.1 sodium:solute symporter [Oceanomicrobium pacificus]
MLSWNALIWVCILYVSFLFLIAFWAERRAARGALGWLRSPVVYTLSISVYCTAWTFYGAVGSAARNGLEFVAIYTGPTLVFIGWWWVLRKLVRIGRVQRTTSIADLISSRYGKSPALGVAVTLLAVIATTPYIALQLQSLTLSFSAFSASVEQAEQIPTAGVTAFWIAAGLALFTILFGTRNVDANERHHGVVTAIAVEAVVKLVALLSVGIFVVWGVSSGPADAFSGITAEALRTDEIFGPRWVAITFLSASAIICLPRMFQVTVVENVDERHLATASWAFPLYLFLMCLFVLPIAIAGQTLLPEGANPDLYVLSVPLAEGRNTLALLAFLGGFSSATSMVIVAAIALSTMVSNHIVMPLWLATRQDDTKTSGDVRSVLLLSRRISIGGMLLLGYLYFRFTGGTGALASIGLIAFAGVAQVLPGLIGGIFWRGATKAGALSGLAAGFIVWAYTLFLPSFEGSLLVSAAAIAEGPFGISALRPQALFGLSGFDPLVHSLFWSMAVNIFAFMIVSVLTVPGQLERIQGAQFVDVFRMSEDGPGVVVQRSATSEDLFTLAQRILGPNHAHRLFSAAAMEQGKNSGLPDPTDGFIQQLERELAGSVGAASAHAMVSQIAGGGTVSVTDLMQIADETAQIMTYSQRLERQSRELEETARQLRLANTRLTEISAQKDAFLSQVSHELRTPMTSVRSFAEILRDTPDLDAAHTRRFLKIIHDESERLTRLLDEILDLSFLESGRMSWRRDEVSLTEVIDRALASTEGLRDGTNIVIHRDRASEDVIVTADFDRLAQVFINLLSNAVKYGKADAPEIRIAVTRFGGKVHVDVSDNGPGIPMHDSERVFEKFARLGEITLAGGAGLGLPISREIIHNLGGSLDLLPVPVGATFRVTLPVSETASLSARA